MIEISQIRLACGTDPQKLENRIRKILGLRPDESFSWRIVRHSVDARKKPELYDVYSVLVSPGAADQEEYSAGFARWNHVPGAGRDPGRSMEDHRADSLREVQILKKAGKRGLTSVRRAEEVPYRFPAPAGDAKVMEHRPVIIGFGPAGLFCALMLARAGYRPIVLERGAAMEERVCSVGEFWRTGKLDPDCNIQFGEGGAGTFSDGKINSNVKDRSGRTGEVVRNFLGGGAPADIAWEQIPHIGTDRLRDVIRTLRNEILELGGEVRFRERAERLLTKDGRITGVVVRRLTSAAADRHALPAAQDGNAEEDGNDLYEILAEQVVLAPGHSARDTFRMLEGKGIPMEAKPFAVGFRVSHPQRLINESQYGVSDPEIMEKLHLSPANYRLTARARDGHGVYSFCMCPGGFVVNASSEPGRLAVNGMSNYLRDAARANSAIVMTVGTDDFGAADALAGMRFQEQLEEKAFRLCRGAVPVQRFGSFEEQRTDAEIPSAEDLCIRGTAAPGALHTLLPAGLTADFTECMHLFGKQIRGFDGPEAYVIGLESRTSSPVRILRDEEGQSMVQGLYPCGEGAGFAGGIMSAAVDGIRTAEKIAVHFRPAEES